MEAMFQLILKLCIIAFKVIDHSVRRVRQIDENMSKLFAESHGLWTKTLTLT